MNHATGALPPGYIPLPSDTYSGFALLRSILRSGSDSDVAQAVAYGRRIRLYPLAQAADPPATVSPTLAVSCSTRRSRTTAGSLPPLTG
jgi:hypothetical protein